MRYRNTRTGREVDLTADEARASGIPGRLRTPRKGPRWVEVVDEPEPDDSDEPRPAEVRAWARAEGIDVPARGNLSTDLIDKFKAANAGQEED
jgi:hypothetical protein